MDGIDQVKGQFGREENGPTKFLGIIEVFIEVCSIYWWYLENFKMLKIDIEYISGILILVSKLVPRYNVYLVNN